MLLWKILKLLERRRATYLPLKALTEKSVHSDTAQQNQFFSMIDISSFLQIFNAIALMDRDLMLYFFWNRQVPQNRSQLLTSDTQGLPISTRQ